MGKIVITGASSEIGQAIARTLSGLGKPILLHCNSNASVLRDFDADIVQADLSQENELERLVNTLGEVDILVNAAAVTEINLLPFLTEEEIEKMVSVNIIATTRLCQAVFPGMCSRRSGVIVNISSVTASRVYRGQSVYGGTKAYIEAFTRGIASEGAKKGVRCNCVAPGGIESGSLKKVVINTGSDILKDSNASGKFGRPEDVAAAVAYLCSEGGRFVNGSTIHVDGGQWVGL
ncbi:MAG: SDR family oxidoreductase [Bacteroidales bacterium]|nr:SDR family oxidoreductase [Bacteroidales bacterium]